jgi:hypothetical protein
MLNLLTLFKEVIPVYTQSYEAHTYKASLTGKVDGTYSYLSALKG